jgi:acyl-CoA synthetase (AMP-forming)/AMP-acid ligase II
VTLGDATTIPGLLTRAGREHGARVALVGERGERVTYADLSDRARGAAAALVELGVEPGDCVALLAPNSVEWVVASLGISSAGAAVVPLNPRWQPEEVVDVVRRARCRVWLVHDELVDSTTAPTDEPAPAARVATLSALARADAATAVVDARMRAVGADDPSHVQFTSGTTGRPKGAVLCHGAMVTTTQSWVDIVGVGPDDRYPIVSPMSHIGGHKTGVLAAMTAGATSLPVARFDPAHLLDLVEAERATVLQGPPTMFQALLDCVEQRSRAPRTLRVAVTGSAPIPPPLLRRMVTTLGLEHVHAGYGLTEATGVCTITRAGDPLELVAESSGRPVQGVDVRIVDEGGAPVPPGCRGEIHVRGPGVMRGYFDDDDATGRAVRDGWLATGDIGWVDDTGNLRIVDRLTDLVIVGGYNVYPAEIERVLGEHPAVAQVAVVGVPDARLGEVPVAFVVARPGGGVDGDTLAASARERLAGYKAPRHVWLVDELPLNAVAKVDKARLAADARARLQ